MDQPGALEGKKMKRTTASMAARLGGMGALTVLGAILMGAAAPASCIFPREDPCLLECAEPAVCGADGVTYGCGAPEAECRGVAVAYPGPCAQECLTDEECGPGRHCSNDDGACLPLGCDCPPGAACACPTVCGGVCVDDPATCTTDEECAADEYCALGPCPLAPCVAREDGTWDCPTCAGTCAPRAGGECDNLGTTCPDGSECVLDYCTTVACPPNADCAWIDECFGHCEAPPPPPPPPSGCDSRGNECAAGETCVIDVCEGVVCPDGAMCDPSEVCYGHCEPAIERCLSDADCTDGRACAFLDPCALADEAACLGADCGQCWGVCVAWEL